MRLIMVCFNGMSYRIAEGSRQECFDHAKKIVNRRKEQGFTVTRLSPNEWEINTDGLVSDYCGYLKVAGDRALEREYGR